MDICKLIERLCDPMDLGQQATRSSAADKLKQMSKERVEINRALAQRGLFLFAHIDGTFTIKEK